MDFDAQTAGGTELEGVSRSTCGDRSPMTGRFGVGKRGGMVIWLGTCRSKNCRVFPNKGPGHGEPAFGPMSVEDGFQQLEPLKSMIL